MPLYGISIGTQAARFPAWQELGISLPLYAVESVAATAWYGEQVAPPAGPLSNIGIAPSTSDVIHQFKESMRQRERDMIDNLERSCMLVLMLVGISAWEAQKRSGPFSWFERMTTAKPVVQHNGDIKVVLGQ